MMRKALALIACALAACATPSAMAIPITGQWGGQHVGLELGAAGGRLDYDCASGTIDGPAMQGADGRFSAAGTHSPGTGGPVQAGVVPPSYPARYAGTVRGDSMTLTVDVPAINASIGPYTLRRGAEPVLMRCL